MHPVRWHRSMKRLAITLLLIVLGVCVFREFATVAYCDGSYDLTVEIDEDSATGVTSVSYLGANGSDMADSFIAMLDELSESMEHRESAEQFAVHVGFSYRASNSGRTWGHVQEYSHLIVVLHQDDGTRVVHRLTVPHRDDSRHIVVTHASHVDR